MVMARGVLEIHQADGAFERIERHLREAGFFGASPDVDPRLRADVYLGYGLSDPNRRRPGADRPSPAALPLAACRISHADDRRDEPGPFTVAPWQPTWQSREYASAVQLAREAIAAGEVYQVNLVQHLCAPFSGDAAGVAAALASFSPRHPQPFVADGWAIVSASPELFLARRGDRVWTEPIKGTRPAGGRADLQTSAKDAAEHVMIVDLERNDLGRICEPGSVGWPQLMAPRSMAGVEHLVSRVEGTLRPDTSWADAVGALFPGGSVTGAPKIAALDHIHALEPVGRGASMGALGTIWPNGDFDLALTIRTFAISGDLIHFWVGGGVVWDSEPDDEVEESWVKARPLLDAIERAAAKPVAA